MSQSDHAVTRDDALLWLNDRIGRDVVVLVGAMSSVSMHGPLSHGGRELFDESGDAFPHLDELDFAGVYLVSQSAGFVLHGSATYEIEGDTLTVAGADGIDFKVHVL
jgi:hypothetical protein